MKRWLMMAFAVFVFSSVNIRAEICGVTLAAKVTTKGSNGYFVLNRLVHV